LTFERGALHFGHNQAIAILAFWGRRTLYHKFHAGTQDDFCVKRNNHRQKGTSPNQLFRFVDQIG
jgi:hypothetical protein